MCMCMPFALLLGETVSDNFSFDFEMGILFNLVKLSG